MNMLIPRLIPRIILLASIITIAACDSAEKTESQEKTSVSSETTAALLENTTMSTESSAVSQEKPSMSEESFHTMEASVTAIDQNTREITLQNASGESVTVVAGDEVKNLAQVEVGDKLTIDYLEAVSIQVLNAEQAEVGAETVSGTASADLGEKPAGAAVNELTIVVVINSIDKENQKVTLQGPQGNMKTVKVKNPKNLEKVVVGDKVMISYSEAIAVKVTE